jgi:4,5-dihydroxyphthalate decarboxylase
MSEKGVGVSKLQINVAVFHYDRTRALFDGRVQVEGCDVNMVSLEPEEAFHRAFKTAEFDVSELSMSSHIGTTSRGENRYIGVPAFVSRLFRHGGIYIRTDRGIKTPADLRGKVIGLPEYQITANLWIRGMLADEYGVMPQDIHWRRGGIEEPGRDERSPIKLPPEIDLQQVPDDKTLSQMLADGELDGVIGARAPSCYTKRMPNIGRLFPDYPQVEEAYWKKTGNFPIMHTMGIKRELAEKYPWLAASVYKAFVQAKALCMHDLAEIGHLATALPWAAAEYERMVELMGPDFWAYGFKENRKILETMTRYSFEQHLSSRKVDPHELFAEPTWDISKI